MTAAMRMRQGVLDDKEGDGMRFRILPLRDQLIARRCSLLISRKPRHSCCGDRCPFLSAGGAFRAG